MDKEELVKSVQSALSNATGADINRIKSRECESDRYEGICINVTGRAVPIRPMLEAVSEIKGWKVENVGMYSDAEYHEDDDEFEPGVIMFCADVSEVVDSEIFV